MSNNNTSEKISKNNYRSTEITEIPHKKKMTNSILH